MCNLKRLLPIVAILGASTVWTDAQAQPGRRGPGGDPDFVQDRDTFHFLLSNHDKIRREVTERTDGVETVTESDDPAIVDKLQEHIEAMYKRMKQPSPIRMRDPLFRELFRHTKQVEMKVETTEKGARVTETSKDPYVAQLIKAHAKVVSGFVARGFAEAQQLHPVPKHTTTEKPSSQEAERPTSDEAAEQKAASDARDQPAEPL